MIFKIIQSPITNFQKPKIFKAKMQNTQKIRVEFFRQCALTHHSKIGWCNCSKKGIRSCLWQQQKKHSKLSAINYKINYFLFFCQTASIILFIAIVLLFIATSNQSSRFSIQNIKNQNNYQRHFRRCT